MTQLQLHRSGQTSLVRLQIRNYRLVVLFMIKICTLFVCYDCIGYFSRFAYTLTHIACFYESVNIQMVLQILIVTASGLLQILTWNIIVDYLLQFCFSSECSLRSCYDNFFHVFGVCRSDKHNSYFRKQFLTKFGKEKLFYRYFCSPSIFPARCVFFID